jgi:hypothetical protein
MKLIINPIERRGQHSKSVNYLSLNLQCTGRITGIASAFSNSTEICPLSLQKLKRPS